MKNLLALLITLAAATKCLAEPLPQLKDVASGQITSQEQFLALSLEGESLVAKGASVKFIIENLNPPRVYFINGRFRDEKSSTPLYAKYHFEFARNLLGYKGTFDQFNFYTYFQKDVSRRTHIVGAIQMYEVEGKSYYGIQLYPQDTLSEDGILFAIKTLRKNFNISDARYAFVTTGLQQTTGSVAPELEKLGIKMFSITDLLGGQKEIPMNKGEAYGYLRFIDIGSSGSGPGQPLTAADIAVFRNLPLDLSVVGGVITYGFQDNGCHVNLKSRERGTPNLVLHDEKRFGDLKTKFANMPVHFKVTATGFEISEVSEAELLTHLKKWIRPKIQKLKVTKSRTLRAFDDMCRSNARSCINATSEFGGKAAKLGFLAHQKVLGPKSTYEKKLGYRLVPYGFGVPLQLYRDFLDAPQNRSVKKAVADFIKWEEQQDPFDRTAATKREEKLSALRGIFYQAVLPPKNLQAIEMAITQLQKQITSDFPEIKIKKLKVRSSANTEDIPGFLGAGLHNSYSAKLTEVDSEECREEGDDDGEAAAESETNSSPNTKVKMRPASIACAIKGVYASLWTKRAVEERSFHGIDHHTAAMGLAIVPTYGFLKKLGAQYEVTANSVVVTKTDGSRGVYGYTISTQTDESLVTNPKPGTHAEVSIAAFVKQGEPVGLTFLNYAKPIAQKPALTAPLLTPETLRLAVEIAAHVEKTYCEMKPTYHRQSKSCEIIWGDPTKASSLDFEIKILGPKRDRLLFKQVREFTQKTK